MPFPGGCCPLFLINEKGQVKEKRDPLLERLEFSFDGCIWENPATRDLFLYQSNIGQFSPKLFRWRSEDSPGEDLSSLLPSELVNREERFLVSRILTNDAIGTDIFLGGDYSCESQTKYGNDSVLRIGYSGQIERARDLFPPRLKDATWSTVEVKPFARNPTGDLALLVITHDFGFNEGAAEVLNLSHDRKAFIRPDRPLPLPSLEGTRSWIARAAIGDLDGDGRADIVLYLRSKDGPFPESSNNLMLLRQNKQGEFDYASCQASGYDTHFAGGFFLSGRLIQLRYDGLFEETRFSF
jgi:hypothetical protein